MTNELIDIDQFIKELDEFLREWGVILRAECTEDWDYDIDDKYYLASTDVDIVVEDTHNHNGYWHFHVLPTEYDE